MYIKRFINQNSCDKDADVYITDGQYELICYIYPYTDKYNTYSIVDCIYGFMCSDITVSNVKEYDIIKLEQYYSYKVTAIVVSAKESIVKVGNMRIMLDAKIPGDICSGEYVHFTAIRFDVVI